MIQFLKELEEQKIDVCKDSFIPYSILSIVHDEVKRKEVTHSKILKSLLCPETNHGFKYTMVESFLQEIELKDISKEHLEDLKVTTEYHVDGRFIDILISWKDGEKKKAVIIENKLNNAHDQKDQLTDYYNSLRKQGYDVCKVVYMHVSPYKGIEHTDAKDSVRDVGINFNIHKLIRWLNECIVNFNGAEHVHQLTAYRDLLSIMSQKFYNLMKSQEIQSKMSPAQIQDLINLAELVKSNDWHNAKYSLILDEIKKDIKEPIMKPEGNYAEFFYRPYQQWVELWSWDKEINLYLCSYDKHPFLEAAGIKFSYHSFEKGKYYFKSESLFSFDYPFKMNELATSLKRILGELSEYKEKPALTG